jgi:hypothetical protein
VRDDSLSYSGSLYNCFYLLAGKTGGSFEDTISEGVHAEEDCKVKNLPHVCCCYIPNIVENEGIVEAIFTLPTNIIPITRENVSVDSTGHLLIISFTWDVQICKAFSMYGEILGWNEKEVAFQALTKAFIASSKSGTVEIKLPCRVSSEIRRFIRFEETIFGVQLISLEFQAKKKPCTLEIIEKDPKA